MKAISFGWTYPAVLARRKTKTRRVWSKEYAARFKKGEHVYALDRDYRYGGKPIAITRLIEAVTFEPMTAMPDSDYEAEGFAFLHKNRDLLPKSMKYDVSPEGFRAWRASDGEMAVVRFEIVEFTAAGIALINELNITRRAA